MLAQRMLPVLLVCRQLQNVSVILPVRRSPLLRLSILRVKARSTICLGFDSHSWCPPRFVLVIIVYGVVARCCIFASFPHWRYAWRVVPIVLCISTVACLCFSLSLLWLPIGFCTWKKVGFVSLHIVPLSDYGCSRFRLVDRCRTRPICWSRPRRTLVCFFFSTDSLTFAFFVVSRFVGNQLTAFWGSSRFIVFLLFPAWDENVLAFEFSTFSFLCWDLRADKGVCLRRFCFF